MGIRKSTNYISKLKRAKRNFRQQAAQRTEFHDAVWRGDPRRLSMDIKEDDLVALDGLGQQSLHLAAERGDVDMVEKLLKKAEEKDRVKNVLTAKCKKEETALHRASWGGSATVVKILLDYAVNADLTITAEPDKDGNTALHTAAEKGFESVVAELVKVNKCTAKNKGGLKPLHYVARSGSESIFKLLLQDVPCSGHEQSILKPADNGGWSPLHYAAASGQLEIIKFLIARGEDINAASHEDNKIGWTPLHFAAINNHHSVIELLLRQKANEVEDRYGWTPWQFARLKENLAVLKALSYKGARISDSVSNEDNRIIIPLFWTSLHRLAVSEQYVSPEQLLDKDTEPILEESSSLFLQAAREGLKDLVKMLLRPETHMLEKDCNEAMLEAAKNGHVTVVNLLLASEKVIGNAEDTAERTALSWAAGNGREAVVKLLLASEKVKDGDAKDKNGRTALLWAADQGHKAMVKLLLASEKVKEGDIKDNMGRAALPWAAANGHEAVVKLLLDSKKVKEGDI